MKKKIPEVRNNNLRKEVLPKLLQRDCRYGMFCEICRVEFMYSNRLQVHHRNGIKSDDKYSNLGLVCPSCNSRNDPRERTLPLMIPKRDYAGTMSGEMLHNLIKQPLFYQFLFFELRKREGCELSKQWILDNYSLNGVSEMTLRRWLKSQTSDGGWAMETPGAVEGVMIKLKPAYCITSELPPLHDGMIAEEFEEVKA
jgi:hypothetical protein